jgi:hypothetical protein
MYNLLEVFTGISIMEPLAYIFHQCQWLELILSVSLI